MMQLEDAHDTRETLSVQIIFRISYSMGHWRGGPKKHLFSPTPSAYSAETRKIAMLKGLYKHQKRLQVYSAHQRLPTYSLCTLTAKLLCPFGATLQILATNSRS
jgi:hypothetical protein